MRRARGAAGGNRRRVPRPALAGVRRRCSSRRASSSSAAASTCCAIPRTTRRRGCRCARRRRIRRRRRHRQRRAARDGGDVARVQHGPRRRDLPAPRALVRGRRARPRGAPRAGQAVRRQLVHAAQARDRHRDRAPARPPRRARRHAVVRHGDRHRAGARLPAQAPARPRGHRPAGGRPAAYSFTTQALWYELGPGCSSDFPLDVLLGSLHAAEHSQIAVLPLLAMCDRWDIGGLSTNAHPQTGGPTIFIYDGHPGGVGITRQGFRNFEPAGEDAHRLITECPCESGCPSCVQSPKCGNLNEPLSKAGALEVMATDAVALRSFAEGCAGSNLCIEAQGRLRARRRSTFGDGSGCSRSLAGRPGWSSFSPRSPAAAAQAAGPGPLRRRRPAYGAPSARAPGAARGALLPGRPRLVVAPALPKLALRIDEAGANRSWRGSSSCRRPRPARSRASTSAGSRSASAGRDVAGGDDARARALPRAASRARAAWRRPGRKASAPGRATLTVRAPRPAPAPVPDPAGHVFPVSGPHNYGDALRRTAQGLLASGPGRPRRRGHAGRRPDRGLDLVHRLPGQRGRLLHRREGRRRLRLLLRPLPEGLDGGVAQAGGGRGPAALQRRCHGRRDRAAPALRGWEGGWRVERSRTRSTRCRCCGAGTSAQRQPQLAADAGELDTRPAGHVAEAGAEERRNLGGQKARRGGRSVRRRRPGVGTSPARPPPARGWRRIVGEHDHPAVDADARDELTVLGERVGAVAVVDAGVGRRRAGEPGQRVEAVELARPVAGVGRLGARGEVARSRLALVTVPFAPRSFRFGLRKPGSRSTRSSSEARRRRARRRASAPGRAARDDRPGAAALGGALRWRSAGRPPSGRRGRR